MTTFSMLPRYDYFSTPSHYVYLFHDAPLCLLFPRCCAVSAFSVLLLRYGYFFHAAVLCLFFSQLLHKEFFHALTRNFRGGGGGPGQSNVFFSLVLSLFYRNQMVNFKEKYQFSWFRRGFNFFQVRGGGLTFSRRGPLAYSL